VSRRNAFLAAAIALGALELGLLVAVRLKVFVASPGIGLALALVVVVVGWALFIFGPLWIRRVRPPALATLRGPTVAPSGTTIARSYFGDRAIEAQWPWGIVIGCVILGATVAGVSLLDQAALTSAILAGLGSGVFLWIDVWTWRWLGRSRARSEDANRLYRVGVLGFGLTAWVISTLWRATEAAALLHGGRVVSLAFGFNLVWRALVYFPICLWGGYVWARAMGELRDR
jgi:hypothetical protein